MSVKKTKSTQESNILNKRKKISNKLLDNNQSNLNPLIQSNRLKRDFFNVKCYDLANALLGKVLVRQLSNGITLKGRIVETECYAGGEDKASHSYNGRQTPGNKPMYMEAGTLYVYMTYGMYHCMNISSMEPGGAVLIRALEPVSGLDEMLNFRNIKLKTPKVLKPKELCNGPSKLCISMDIDKNTCNALDACNNDKLWMEYDDESSKVNRIISAPRIGIQSAGEYWASQPLRFYILNNMHVSKRDKKREEEFL